MTERAERLRERVEDAVSEYLRAGAKTEDAPIVLRAVVEELGVTEGDVKATRATAIYAHDVSGTPTPKVLACADALSALLEAAGEEGDFANRPGKIAVFSEDQNFDMEGVDDD